MAECDLVIRGGTVATEGSSGECDLGVLEGKVGQMGGSLRGKKEIDASGALVLPGGVHMHVHLSPLLQPVTGALAWVDYFNSGFRAAIAGGVATPGSGSAGRACTCAHLVIGTADLVFARA